MEPSNTPNFTPVVNPSPQPYPINQVTTVSKVLAGILFIMMPFIGGYIGYQYGLTEPTLAVPVVVETIDEVNATTSVDVPTATTLSTSTGLFKIDFDTRQVYYPSHTQGDRAEFPPVTYIPVPNVDFDTFEALNVSEFATFFAKDISNVYFLVSDPWSGEVTFAVLPNADPDTFVPNLEREFPISQGNTYRNYYSRDMNQVYYRGDVIAEASPVTFKLIDSVAISMDDDTVFYWAEPITGADPGSFEILSDVHLGSVYAKDSRNFYVDTCAVPGVDGPSVIAMDAFQKKFSDATGEFIVSINSGAKKPANCADISVVRQ
jgi:hypothetical protein